MPTKDKLKWQAGGASVANTFVQSTKLIRFPADSATVMKHQASVDKLKQQMKLLQAREAAKGGSHVSSTSQ